MRTPDDKARRSRNLAQFLAIMAGAYVGTVITSLLTNQPLAASVTSSLAIILAVLSAFAFRASRRWRDLADSEAQR